MGSWDQDAELHAIITKLLLDPISVPDFTFVEGKLKYKEQIGGGKFSYN